MRQTTCVDQNQNNCSVAACTSPDGVSGTTRSIADPTCCQNQTPNEQPVITPAVGPSCSTDGKVTISWTYTGSGGCGGSWGYNCSSPTPTNFFRLRDNVRDNGVLVPGYETINVNLRTISPVLAAGDHSLQICANNGYTGNCSVAATITTQIDTTAPLVPSISSTNANCGGSIAFSWPDVNDAGRGCFGNVDYQLQIVDGVTWPVNNWMSSPSWPTINGWTKSYASNTTTVRNSAPQVGTAYKARALSSDASYVNKSTWSAGSVWTTGIEYCCSNPITGLTTNGVTCNSPSTFPTTYSWNKDNNATGYVFSIPVCGPTGLTKTIVGKDANSVVLSQDEINTCAAALPTGTVTWTVFPTYPGTCASQITQATFNFDKTPPPIPVPTISLIPNAACIGQYFLGYTWNAVTDDGTNPILGCAGLDMVTNQPYWSQAQASPITAPPEFSVNVFSGANANDWTTLRLQQTGSHDPGSTIYTHVRSRDKLDNQSAWSGYETTIIPTPLPYPTIHIAGPIKEIVGSETLDMNIPSTNPISFTPSFNPSTGVGATCVTSGPTYACNVTFSSVPNSCTAPTTTMGMSGSYSGYDSFGWNDFPTGIVLNVTPATHENPTLYLKYTPPVDGGAGAWFKLKDTSFLSRVGRQNIIPNNVRGYDLTDLDTSHNTLSGNSGLLLQNDSLIPGGNAGWPSAVVYSTKNWHTIGYTSTDDVSYAQYLDYMNSRKTFTDLGSRTTLSSSLFPADGIYKVTGNISIADATEFAGKNVVLYVDGSIAFTGDFTPTAGSSVAILAKNISISSTVKEIDAVLIAQQSVDVGTAQLGLKIKGNLINESATFTLTRTQSSLTKPSLFVEFDPQAYLNLLPYLSTSTYDWRQIQ